MFRVYVCMCVKLQERQRIEPHQKSERSSAGEVVSSCQYLPVPQETMPALWYWNRLGLAFSFKTTAGTRK